MNPRCLVPIWILTLVSVSIVEAQEFRANQRTGEPDAPSPLYAIAIHGGAGSYPQNQTPQTVEDRRHALRQALRTGTDILKAGGSSLHAVEQAIRVLEDDPLFNAGVGSVCNADGTHELDASIMDGRDLACGAVAGTRRVKNPITLARLVMQETPHVLLAGGGAEELARQLNVELVEPDYFATEYRRRQWQKHRSRPPDKSPAAGGNSIERTSTNRIRHYGTVGCVALDSHGNLAAGTSTGGTPFKRYGRVGDSPIVGAGTYADNATCAVSCTGHGEQFIRHAVAYDIAAQMRYADRSLEQSVVEVIANRLQPGDGGIIAVDRLGHIVMKYSTPSMARAAADSSGRFEILWELSPRRGDDQQPSAESSSVHKR